MASGLLHYSCHAALRICELTAAETASFLKWTLSVRSHMEDLQLLTLSQLTSGINGYLSVGAYQEGSVTRSLITARQLQKFHLKNFFFFCGCNSQ